MKGLSLQDSAFLSSTITRSLIPIMTDYTTPSGIASASSFNSTIGSYAWRPFDNNSVTLWTPGVGTSGEWLQYQFARAVFVNASSVLFSIAPTSYILYGSNNGSTFTQLDSESYPSGGSGNNIFVNTTCYSYYRWTFSTTSNVVFTAQLYGY